MALQTLKLRGLGMKGVVSDLAPFDTGVDSWSDAKNIRFSRGTAEKIRGHIPTLYEKRQDAMVYQGIDQVPMHLVYRPLQTSPWVYCTQNAIWSTNGRDHVRISSDILVGGTEEKPSLIPYESPWSSTLISNSLIINNRQLRTPLGLVEGSTSLKPLQNWLSSWDANVVRTYKNFVMMLGGGEAYPQRVRWSNLVPPNSLPADWGFKYLWTEEDQDKDPTHIAGEPIPPGEAEYGSFINGSAGGYNDISFVRGRIVEGKQLRDQFIIYTTEEVITCEYVGGNDIFRFRNLFDDGGVISPDCVAEFNNSHFVVSSNDVYIHNGSSKQSIIDNKVRVKLIEKLTENQYNSVKVLPYLTENEIWITYAGNDAVGVHSDEVGSGESYLEATQAAIFNYKEGTWSFIDLPRTNDIKLGPLPVYDGDAKDNPDAWSQLPNNYLWEDSIELWNLAGGGSSQNFREQSLICASTDGGFYILDRGRYYSSLDKYNETTKVWSLKHEDIISTLSKLYIDLDEITESIDYKSVLSLWPQVTGAGEIYIRVGGAEVPGGTIRWGESVKYVCGKDRKVDIRINNRYLCLDVSGRGVGDWNLSGFDVIIRVGGRR